MLILKITKLGLIKGQSTSYPEDFIWMIFVNYLFTVDQTFRQIFKNLNVKAYYIVTVGSAGIKVMCACFLRTIIKTLPLLIVD